MEFATAGAVLESHLPQLPAGQEQTFEMAEKGKWLGEKGTEELFGHFLASLVGYIPETWELWGSWSDIGSMAGPEGQCPAQAAAPQRGRGHHLSIKKRREKPSGVQTSRSSPWPVRTGGKSLTWLGRRVGKAPWWVKKSGKIAQLVSEDSKSRQVVRKWWEKPQLVRKGRKTPQSVRKARKSPWSFWNGRKSLWLIKSGRITWLVRKIRKSPWLVWNRGRSSQLFSKEGWGNLDFGFYSKFPPFLCDPVV